MKSYQKRKKRNYKQIDTQEKTEERVRIIDVIAVIVALAGAFTLIAAFI